MMASIGQVKHDVMTRCLYDQFALAIVIPMTPTLALVSIVLDTRYNLVIDIIAMTVGEPKSLIEPVLLDGMETFSVDFVIRTIKRID
jgi:hypothetical protein